MNQPTKDALREQLALAADEIIRLRGCLAGAKNSHAWSMIRFAAREAERRSWRGRVRAWWRRVRRSANA